MTTSRYPVTGLRLPRSLVAGVFVVCALPALLWLLGFDLGTERVFGTINGIQEVYERLRGAFIHTILEAAAVGVAFITGLLAVAHYRMQGGIVAPILALALFFGGVLDAFHILAANYLVLGRAGHAGITILSWSIGRMFHATILVVGVVALVSASRRTESVKPDRFVASWGIAFGILTILVVAWMLTTRRLPEVTQTEGFIQRPWDIPPLALYVVAAGLALPSLTRFRSEAFVQAVWLSMAPAIAAQAYMGIGSSELFDHAYYSAHVLKVVAYAVPFVGLALEYAAARRSQLAAVALRTRAEVERAETERRLADVTVLAEQLEDQNEQLSEFAYAISHDLRAPLRAVSSIATWLEEDLDDKVTGETREYLDLMRNRVDHLEQMVSALLDYARVGASEDARTSVDLSVLTAEIVQLLALPGSLAVRYDGPLPTVRGHEAYLRQVFQNLISNAGRYARSEVRIGCRRESGQWIFWVKDDGPGIEPRFQEKIWSLFGRLESRDEVEGTGVGLALVRKAVETWRGKAWVESTPGKGATFYFTVPEALPVQPPPAPELDGSNGAPEARAAGATDHGSSTAVQ